MSPNAVEQITWDGRLENRSELIHELGGELSSDSTDLAIVTAPVTTGGQSVFTS